MDAASIAAALAALLTAQLCIAAFGHLPRGAQSWAFALLTLGVIGALIGLAASRAATADAARLAAFGCALVIWGWQEIGFGSGARYLGMACETRRAHELTWLGPLGLVLAVTWGAPNQTGRDTLLLLCAAHLGLRSCVAAAQRVGSTGPLLAPPWFAAGLPSAQLLSMVFPLTASAMAGGACALLARATATGQLGLALLALPLGFGTCALWVMVLLPGLRRWSAARQAGAPESAGMGQESGARS